MVIGWNCNSSEMKAGTERQVLYCIAHMQNMKMLVYSQTFRVEVYQGLGIAEETRCEEIDPWLLSYS